MALGGTKVMGKKHKQVFIGRKRKSKIANESVDA